MSISPKSMAIIDLPTKEPPKSPVQPTIPTQSNLFAPMITGALAAAHLNIFPMLATMSQAMAIATTTNTDLMSSSATMKYLGILNADRLLQHLMSPEAPALYLGSCDIMSQVGWQNAGKQDVLVHVGTGITNPNDPSNTSPQVEQVLMSCVGIISSNKFFMTASGDYNLNSIYEDCGLASVKAIATLQSALDTMGDLASLWLAMVKNGNTIQNCTPEVMQAKIGWVLKEGIRMTHHFFEPEEDLTPAETKLLETWLVEGQLMSCLEALVTANTHVAVPLPAYGVTCRLIKPANYEQQLQGSFVVFEFYLKHWHFGHHQSLTSVAKIKHITVLRGPVSIVSPSKCSCTPRKDLDDDSSPSKCGCV
ncbi:hypothetical protein FRB95_012475 [Tulasnella sp. JGI-2019a]|nr:hypothetical protein FRB95_012475 [Tulasnella sp. JGI-2019a]